LYMIWVNPGGHGTIRTALLCIQASHFTQN
jgi:hypothetical protein